MKNLKIIGAIVLSVGIFIFGLLVFPLEFFFLSFIAVLYLLRTIERQIDTMGKKQVQELIHR